MLENLRKYITSTVLRNNVDSSLGVSAVPVGLAGDGLTLSGDSIFDVDTFELQRQARILNKTNPLYHRALNTLKAYVLGNGFSYHTSDGLRDYMDILLKNMFIDNFLSQAFEELVKTGNLYIAAHILDGMELRIIPSNRISSIKTDDEDYTIELEYHEFNAATSRVWLSWQNPKATSPFVFHLKINNDVGELMGVGEFSSSYVWMNRYAHLLRDRVHVNVSLKSFFWIFSIPDKYWKQLRSKFDRTPATGSTLTIPEGVNVSTVSPNIGAKDFKHDRVAILEMVASGTSGLSPLDYGELETSNLATAKVTSANKAIIMRRLQKLFFDFMQIVFVHTINKFSGIEFKLEELSVYLNSIDHRDIHDVILSGLNVVKMFPDFIEIYGETEELKKMLLNLFINTTNTPLSVEDFDKIIQGKNK